MISAARTRRLVLRPLLTGLLIATALPACRGSDGPLQPPPVVAAAAPSEAARSHQHLPGRWGVVNAFPGLTFQNPTFAVMPPRDGGFWFVGEREGRIWRVANDPRSEKKSLLLDLRRQTLGWHDLGLLNLAFHPEFGRPGSPNRGYFYLWYNFTRKPHPGPGAPFHGSGSWTRLSRFEVADRARRADRSSETVLIQQRRTNIDHMGGGLLFHPGDGFLYLAVGDGGKDYVEKKHGGFTLKDTDDPQRIDRRLLSGVLRIDVDCRRDRSHPILRQPLDGRSAHYCIPNDNPWVDPGGSVLEEFFAVGLRNPHRMSHDAPSDRIYLGDVGNVRADEVNLIKAGGNYGWSVKEGDDPNAALFQPLGTDTSPLFSHRDGGFSAIIGGHVYRGRAHPELAGFYLFGDNGTGVIWTLDPSQPEAARELLRLPGEMRAYGGLSSFAVDQHGEIYLCILGDNQRGTGTIQKLVSKSAPPTAVAATLSATNLFADLRTLKPAPGLTPYEVNSPFWSDHADKQRWLSVPAGSRLGFHPQGAWSLPPGTVAVKHFEIALHEQAPQRKHRLETRVLRLEADGELTAGTYRWRADGSEADLVEVSSTDYFSTVARKPFGPFSVTQVGGPKGGRVETRGSEHRMTNPDAETLISYVVEPGDFDVAARWPDVAGAMSGLMMRESFTPWGSSALIAWQPSATPRGRHLLLEEANSRGQRTTRVLTDVAGEWLRMARTGRRVEWFSSEDGQRWRRLGQTTLPTKGDVVGLFTDGGGTAVVTQARRNERRDHLYPEPGECGSCHTRSAGNLLGVNTRQWNRSVQGANGGPLNQLVRAWQHGLVDQRPPTEELSRLERLVPLEDRTAPVEHRVRSYLDANCAYCHRPGGVAQVGFDARFETPLPKQGLLWGRRRWPSVPEPSDFIVTPGSRGQSELWKRLAAHSMPPLGGLLRDVAAVELLGSWINGLDPGPRAGLGDQARSAVARRP